MGLENIIKMYDILQKPAYAIPTVHIAGTNGKGSVAVKIAEVLRLSGYRTGD